jgi:hypothetical protein
MAYKVVKTFTLKEEYHSADWCTTLEEFKLLLEYDVKDEAYFIECMRSANLAGWSSREAEFIAIRNNKTEVFDETSQTLTVTKIFDTEEQFLTLREFKRNSAELQNAFPGNNYIETIVSRSMV